MQLKSLTVLHAEDDSNDVLLLKRAVAKLGLTHRFFYVGNGEEAIHYLRAEGEFSDRVKFPFPNMLIVDLKMPKKGGLDVLQWLSTHDECGVIPTMVLTSSAQPDDIKRSYQLAACGYFTKPSNLAEWNQLFDVILAYWRVAHVPEPPPKSICR
ncbi:MAG: two-component system response regulator [Verrucomicrobiales bacterium]|nr:two-component system response regulator [Verrucomicrobiales bacterium]